MNALDSRIKSLRDHGLLRDICIASLEFAQQFDKTTHCSDVLALYRDPATTYAQFQAAANTATYAANAAAYAANAANTANAAITANAAANAAYAANAAAYAAAYAAYAANAAAYAANAAAYAAITANAATGQKVARDEFLARLFLMVSFDERVSA